MNALRRRAWQALLLSLPTAIRAAFINFDNCLPDSITQSDPLQLQFTPLFFDAKFNRSADANYPLNVTIYGNVSGQQFAGTYPAPDSPQWKDGNETFGKIAGVGTANKYTTLLSNFKVVTYDAWDAPGTEFCSTLVNGSCPLGPYFSANASDPYDLPAFSIQHDFGSPYSFTSLIGTIRILSGDTGASDIACISSSITPYLGDGIVNLITYLPAAVLILEAIKVLLAGIFSPWGSTDIFRFTSNYGRDPDLLRLVTPGFGDCLQYIQFATLSGALSLQYPGFYQPAVSQTAWSILEFNNSFVSHGNGTQSLVDGIYKYNGTYGMTAMSQLVGMSSIIDVWACMAVWLLVIAGIVVILCQLGFLGRWIYRTLTDTTEEDLRSKNLPFTMGNIIRLMFNYFILPIVSLSLFQLVISPDSPASVVACAVVLFVLVLLGGVWILRVIFTTKPRTILFDDMPTVLLYGPLYNTYSDSAAPFALVPVFITFMRGVAFGAIQPSGIAQVIVLAICEVILILTLNGFRPFQNQTSMNAYHTAFSIARLITVLLSIAFVETLGVNDSVKGWIGYAILIIHALVLVFGFFLNALQTIVEVTARTAGVGADPQTGAVRGSILTWRMLRKRPDRPNTGDRGSMTSNAAILQDHDARSNYARSRSMSASSQQLLNQATAPSINRMSGVENFSSGGDYVSTPGADTDNAQNGLAYLNGQATSNKPVIASNIDAADTFYRPPRQRRATNDLLTPGTKTRRSTVTSDYLYQEGLDDHKTHMKQASDGGMYPDRESPAPAYFRDRSDSNDNVTRPDYTTREVDLYYRGEQPRGPALSGQPTRKLKTGPADPEGPAASAQSWFQRLAAGFKGKQKESSKGFEVVRSSRMPKDMMEPAPAEDVEMQTSPSMNDEPYRDSPSTQQDDFPANAGAERAVSPVDAFANGPRGRLSGSLDFDFGLGGGPSRHDSGRHAASSAMRPSQDIANTATTPDIWGGPHIDVTRGEASCGHQPRHTTAPSLAPVEGLGDINLMPSRYSSRRSGHLDDIDRSDSDGGQNWLRDVDGLQWNHNRSTPASRNVSGEGGLLVSIPRHGSRRTPSQDVTPDRGHNLFDGFDSFGRNSPELLSQARVDEPRPSSFVVGHHRAADSITRNAFGATAALQGESAEMHYGTTPDSGSVFERP